MTWKNTWNRAHKHTKPHWSTKKVSSNETEEYWAYMYLDVLTMIPVFYSHDLTNRKSRLYHIKIMRYFEYFSILTHERLCKCARKRYMVARVSMWLCSVSVWICACVWVERAHDNMSVLVCTRMCVQLLCTFCIVYLRQIL